LEGYTRVADEGIWLSTQPFTVCNEPQLSADSNAKLAVVCKGTEFVYDTIRSIPKLKVTYGTDIFNENLKGRGVGPLQHIDINHINLKYLIDSSLKRSIFPQKCCT